MSKEHTKLVWFHVERGGKFMCDDKHADRTWFGEFDDPFLCRWDSLPKAVAWACHEDVVRVSVDGVLV